MEKQRIPTTNYVFFTTREANFSTRKSDDYERTFSHKKANLKQGTREVNKTSLAGEINCRARLRHVILFSGRMQIY